MPALRDAILKAMGDQAQFRNGILSLLEAV